jgi:hypothetical protein
MQHTPRVVKALDKLEAQIQQNEADLSTWIDCEFEDAVAGIIRKFCDVHPLLSTLCDRVVDESKDLVSNATRDEGLSALPKAPKIRSINLRNPDGLYAVKGGDLRHSNSC